MTPNQLRLLSRVSTGILAAALLLGVALRLRLYLMDRPFWGDPASLALNLVDRGYFELLYRLELGQAAPIGFLFVSKCVSSVFDYKELSLMVFPLALSLGALVLFLRLSSSCVGNLKAPLAYVPFATSTTAIYYAAEFKQYSADLFFSSLTLAAALSCLSSNFKKSSLILFALNGIIAVWFSHAAIIVIAGSGIALLLHAVFGKDRRATKALVLVGAGILSHFLILFFFQIWPSLHPYVFRQEWHQVGFAPFPPISGEDLRWYVTTLTRFFSFPLGFEGAVAVPLLGLVLGVVPFQATRAEATKTQICLFPLLLLFLLSCSRLYPITPGEQEVASRLVLFTLPPTLILIARGIGFLACPSRKVSVFLLLSLFLFFPSVGRALSWPQVNRQDMRSLVRYLADHHEEGDQIYVPFASMPAFRYYTRKRPLDFVRAPSPSRRPAAFERDLRRFSAKRRVWLIVSNDFNGEGAQIMRRLEHLAESVEAKDFSGARLALHHMLVIPQPPGP